MASNNTSTDGVAVTEAVESETAAHTDTVGDQQETTEAAHAVDTPGDDVTPDSGAAATGSTEPADTPETGRGGRSGGHLAGAGAVVSAALSVASLTGTPLSEMLRTNQRISGQIAAQGGGNVDQIDVLYSAPWHTAALSNGIIAVIAVLIGGAALAAFPRAGSQQWVKAVALGGVVLGLLGVLVAGGMYFDLFASPPELPTMTTPGGMGR